ncbi:MAG TPA: hypothetical protein VFE27_09295 [Acidobacteriaceae bacterium]|nr:hypothetical protein [Acidobacteriaceae bacterium]
MPQYKCGVSTFQEGRVGISTEFGFVSGHDLRRAINVERELGLQAAEKLKFFEGGGLQAVRKRLKAIPALAAEGTAFAPYSTFFRSLFSPCYGSTHAATLTWQRKNAGAKQAAEKPNSLKGTAFRPSVSD